MRTLLFAFIITIAKCQVQLAVESNYLLNNLKGKGIKYDNKTDQLFVFSINTFGSTTSTGPTALTVTTYKPSLRNATTQQVAYSDVSLDTEVPSWGVNVDQMWVTVKEYGTNINDDYILMCTHPDYTCTKSPFSSSGGNYYPSRWLGTSTGFYGFSNAYTGSNTESFAILQYDPSGYRGWNTQFSKESSNYQDMTMNSNMDIILIATFLTSEIKGKSFFFAGYYAIDTSGNMRGNKEFSLRNPTLCMVIGENQKAVFLITGGMYNSQMYITKILRLTYSMGQLQSLDLPFSFLSAKAKYDPEHGYIYMCGITANYVAFVVVVETGVEMFVVASIQLELAGDCVDIEIDQKRRSFYVVTSAYTQDASAKIWVVKLRGTEPEFRPLVIVGPISTYDPSLTSSAEATSKPETRVFIPSNSENGLAGLAATFGLSAGGAVALLIFIALFFVSCIGVVGYLTRKAELKAKEAEQIRMERRMEKKRKRKERRERRREERRSRAQRDSDTEDLETGSRTATATVEIHTVQRTATQPMTNTSRSLPPPYSVQGNTAAIY